MDGTARVGSLCRGPFLIAARSRQLADRPLASNVTTITAK
jgi:hypothetical protein